MPAPDFLSEDYLRDPYAHHKMMRDDHPLYFHEPTKSWVISRYEDVVRAFKEPAFSNSVYEWQLKDVYPDRTIVQMDGQVHAAHRNIVAPSLREHDIRSRSMAVLHENARRLIDRFRQRGEVDLVAEFTTQYPINVTIDLLGLSRSDCEKIHGWYQALVRLVTNLEQNPQIREEGVRARKELCEYLLPLIRARRVHPEPDLLSAMATAVVDGERLKDTEVQAFVGLMLVGGGETLDNALGLLFKNLLRHPHVLDELRADRSLVAKVFAESLRYTPPVHMVMRVTVEAAQVSGGTIPPGSLVACMIAAANRDERQFRAPERFDIHREDLDVARSFTAATKQLAFGSGRHFCAGAALAKLEVEVAVNQLLDAMHDLRHATSEPQDYGYFIRGPRTLPLRFIPASS